MRIVCLALCLSAAATSTGAFAPLVRVVSSWTTRRGAATSSADAWTQLDAEYQTVKTATTLDDESTAAPVLTLYRDTNGWCPFCERVWLSLQVKGIKYEEKLVNLRDKPEWFLKMAEEAGHPKGLVPAIKLAHSGEVIFESLDILERLESDFPEAVALKPKNNPDSEALVEFCPDFMNASASFVYGRDDEGSEGKKANFFSALDKLDRLLSASPSGLMSCTDTIGQADVMMVPFLERYRYQLPYQTGVSIVGGQWPNIDRWCEAMDSVPEYVNRVKGDEYSWVAVVSTFMKMFNSNGTSLDPARSLAADQADAKANMLLESVADEASTILGDTSEGAVQARLEAAHKLLTNHGPIIRDATAAEVKSQKELERVGSDAEREVEELLQETVMSLLQAGTDSGSVTDSRQPSAVKARAARVISSRLCAPRDMGSNAARQLRAALLALERVYS